MENKIKLMEEQDKLRRKATLILWDSPSKFEEMLKIMFRLNYIKGALFALEVINDG